MRFAFPPYGATVLRLHRRDACATDHYLFDGNYVSVSKDFRKSFTRVQGRADSEPGVGWNGWGHGKNYLRVVSFLDSRTARK